MTLGQGQKYEDFSYDAEGVVLYALKVGTSDISRVKMNADGSLHIVEVRPATVTVYNIATTDDGWTAIATGLSGVLAWKLTEESGQAFDYAYAASPTAYMTSYGIIQRDTNIGAVYARRRGGTNINLQLEVWAV